MKLRRLVDAPIIGPATHPSIGSNIEGIELYVHGLEALGWWEGAGLPNQPSVRSVAPEPVNQLRDPAFFDEGGQTFVVYSVAGERGLAVAEVVD